MSRIAVILIIVVACLTLVSGCGCRGVRGPRLDNPAVAAEPTPPIEGPVALCIVIDHTSWWAAHGEAAKRWVLEELLPWLHGGDAVVTVAIGPRPGSDRAVFPPVELARSDALDPRQQLAYEEGLERLRTQIREMEQLFPGEEGSDIWNAVDRGAALLARYARGRTPILMLMSDCRVDPDPTPGAPPAGARPTLSFPAGARGLVTGITHEGFSPLAFSQFKQEIKNKLEDASLTLAEEDLFEAGASEFDLETVLPRKTSLF